MTDLHCVQDKESILRQFDPESSTWLVSDLRSKRELQLKLLQTHGVLPETAVLRASELWRKILLKVRPDYHLVSLDLVRGFTSDWLKGLDISWLKGVGSVDKVLTSVSQFLPILSHPSGEELMLAWLDDHPDSQLRWHHWFEVSRRLWAELNARKWLPGTWAAGVLCHEKDLSQWWGRGLVVDLGAQISLIETEILKAYGQGATIEVLVPKPTWLADYREIDHLYRRLSGAPHLKESEIRGTGELPLPPERVSFSRSTTMVGEVKVAVHQVRQWLEQGMAPGEVAVVAPNIEDYWPSLSQYFIEEGVPAEKSLVGRLHAVRSVQSWLARLRLKLGRTSSLDLEMVEAEQGFATIDFRQFYRLFSEIYDEGDLRRDQRMAHLYQREYGPQDVMDRTSFVAWTLKHWPEEKISQQLENVFLKIYQDCPHELRLSLNAWFDYLQYLVASQELVITRGDPGGVNVTNVNSLEWLEVKKVFFLGMTDRALRQPNELPISSEEVEIIERDLGFTLPHPEQMQLEFELRWLLDASRADFVLSCAATDTAGDVLSPHPFWLIWQAQMGVAILERLEEYEYAPQSRWDLIQQADWQTILKTREFPSRHAEDIERALRVDMGLEEPGAWVMPRLPRLSSSRLESYAQCPFTAGTTYLGLVDDAIVDMDLDASVIGRWQHHIVTELAQGLSRGDRDWSEEKLTALIWEAAAKVPVVLGHDSLKPSWEKRMLNLARDFCAFEKQWQSEHSSWQVMPPILIRGVWNTSAKDLQLPDDGSVVGPEFRGEIDRLDLHPDGRAMIVDYKKSGQQLTNMASWLRNDRFQLGLYALAARNGLTPVAIKEIVGAFYLSLTPPRRARGFWVSNDENGSETEALGAKTTKVSEADFNQFISDLRVRVDEIVQGVLAGRFGPWPRESKICHRCHWRSMCRYPKFN